MPYQPFHWLTLIATLIALTNATPPAVVRAEAPCTATAPLVVHLNTADETELQKLPRVGPARARAIVKARQQLGGFKRISQLLRVKGIGRATLRLLRPHVTLAQPEPPNDSGAAREDPLR